MQCLCEANPKDMGLREIGLALKSLAKREKDYLGIWIIGLSARLHNSESKQMKEYLYK